MYEDNNKTFQQRIFVRVCVNGRSPRIFHILLMMHNSFFFFLRLENQSISFNYRLKRKREKQTQPSFGLYDPIGEHWHSPWLILQSINCDDDARGGDSNRFDITYSQPSRLINAAACNQNEPFFISLFQTLTAFLAF